MSQTSASAHAEGTCLFRVKQLEDENGDFANNMCRLKSQTEKLDEVYTRLRSEVLIYISIEECDKLSSLSSLSLHSCGTRKNKG